MGALATSPPTTEQGGKTALRRGSRLGSLRSRFFGLSLGCGCSLLCWSFGLLWLGCRNRSRCCRSFACSLEEAIHVQFNVVKGNVEEQGLLIILRVFGDGTTVVSQPVALVACAIECDAVIEILDVVLGDGEEFRVSVGNALGIGKGKVRQCFPRMNACVLKKREGLGIALYRGVAASEVYASARNNVGI